MLPTPQRPQHAAESRVRPPTGLSPAQLRDRAPLASAADFGEPTRTPCRDDLLGDAWVWSDDDDEGAVIAEIDALVGELVAQLVA